MKMSHTNKQIFRALFEEDVLLDRKAGVKIGLIRDRFFISVNDQPMQEGMCQSIQILLNSFKECEIIDKKDYPWTCTEAMTIAFKFKCVIEMKTRMPCKLHFNENQVMCYESGTPCEISEDWQKASWRVVE